MQRVGATTLIAVLVILAGCSGVFGGGGESRETLTPAPVPTDEPTPTPVPQLAPGLNQQGIENVSALIAAHNSSLRNHSFTTKSNTTRLDPNGTIRFRSTGTLRAGPPGKGVYSISVVEESYTENLPNNRSYPVHSELWAKGKRVFREQTLMNGTTTYDRRRIRVRPGTPKRYLQYILEPFDAANTSVEVQERNGTRLYLVRGNAQSTQDFRSGNLSLRLLVDSQGVIHSYRRVRQQRSDEDISKVINEQRYMEIGSTDAPDRPSWVEKARNRTTPYID